MVSTYTPDSTKILHTAYADFVSRQIGRPIHVVQYDDGLPILAVKLFKDGQPYTIPTNADVNIKLGKSDGRFVYNPALGCDSARHIVYFEITYQMVVLAETLSPVVEILIGTSVSASSSIGIVIDRNPVQNEAIESTSEWKTIVSAIEYAKEAVGAAASASASCSSASESKDKAKVSETNAKTSENNAKVSEINAAISASTSSASSSNAAESAASASVSASNAKTSETNAEKSERNAKTSADTASEKADESYSYSVVSKSYAVGGTGSRTGENMDNAKYYSEQASESMRNVKNSVYNADIYSLLSKSYAVGDSVVVLADEAGNEILTDDGSAIALFGRDGEDSDNAKYYSECAAASAANIKTSEVNAKASETNAATSASTATTSETKAKTSETNAKASETNAKTSETNAAASASSASMSESKAKTSEINAKTSETNAKVSEENIKGIEDACCTYSKIVESYAVGDTDYRENECVDNAKYYYQQTRQISEGLTGVLLPMGTIMFRELPTQTKNSGYMFNISDEFVSDDTFKDGGGLKYPAGTNVYYTADGYWDCLSGSSVTGVKGNAETAYRKGVVNITPEDIGLGNVDNTADSAKSVANAAKLTTARTMRTNLGSTSTASFDGTANVTPGVTGTLPIANGGTGNTTTNAAATAFIKSLEEATSIPTDTDHYVSQAVGGSTWHRRTMSALWEYIKSKISSVLALTSSDYNGRAATASKWHTARNINGMAVQGDANRVNYGLCSTAAATAAKTVACTGFALITGAEITVKFTVTNTASNPTLNVNNTGAKSIHYNGGVITAGYLAAYRTYTFRYNGTQYDLVGDINTDTNTVYTHPTTAGYKHIPSGGSSGQILRWGSNGTAVWGAENGYTYSTSGNLTDEFGRIECYKYDDGKLEVEWRKKITADVKLLDSGQDSANQYHIIKKSANVYVWFPYRFLETPCVSCGFAHATMNNPFMNVTADLVDNEKFYRIIVWVPNLTQNVYLKVGDVITARFTGRWK